MDKHVKNPEQEPDQTEEPADEAGAEAGAPGPDGEPEPVNSPDPLHTGAESNESLEHQLLRLRADFDNYRKRTSRQRGEWTRDALENLIGDLLPVLDHFELGLANAREHDAQPGVLKGFELVEEQLRGVLRKFELHPVDADKSAAFDPELQEAVNFLPDPEAPADTVIAQVRRGYRLGERLLRPSQVVVSSGAPDTPDAGPQSDATPEPEGDHVDDQA